MSITKSSVAFTILLSAIALPTLISAQSKGESESQPGNQRPGDQQPGESQTAEKPRGRLPNHFGKLGISEEQRTRIYSIQADYDVRIDELLSQIEELVANRDSDINAVLTEGQRARLRELREEARNRRSSDDGGGNESPGESSNQE